MEKKIISIIFCVLGIIPTGFFLFIGLSSIGASGLNAIGVLAIWPSVIALTLIIFDLLIAVDVIKKGLIYSFISSLIKILFMAFISPLAMYHLRQKIINPYTPTNLWFYILIYSILIIITVPSILNIIKIISARKKAKLQQV